MIKLRIIGLLIVSLFATMVVAQVTPSTGQLAPLLTLKSPEGKSFSPEKYLGQGPIVLAFFASWSKSCQQEMAFLTQLNKKYASKGLKIIAISFDRNSADLNSFLSGNKIDFDILYDKKLKTLKDFQIMIIPTLLVLDNTGIIKNTYVDFDDNVAKAVEGAIK